MIVEPRLVEYLNSLETELPEHLAALEEYAIAHEVPIIRKEAQSFLRMLLELKQPKKILEVGTAIGFSASLLCEYMPQDCKLTTIEKVPMRIVEAEKNLAALKRCQDVTFLTGDAEEVLKRLREQGNQYDFVFMDAAKAQYMNFLVQILPMLPAGALLVTDNVLQEGSIVESKYSITRRDRTIHMRMREYLYELKHNELLTTSIVAVGDGMALSVKRQEGPAERSTKQV
ncbi:MAG: O-methyltransferase [Lachnospiraceae bacterium]|nr:O-methyltransferase [Lachnospiraceae bacterium]